MSRPLVPFACILAVLIGARPSQAQPVRSAVSIALAGSGLGMGDGDRAPNPASLTERHLGFATGVEYGLPELAWGAVRVGVAGAIAEISGLGFDGYRETQMVLGASRQEGRSRVGARLEVLYASVRGFSAIRSLAWRLGALRHWPNGFGATGAIVANDRIGVGHSLPAGRGRFHVDVLVIRGILSPRAGGVLQLAGAVHVMAGIAAEPQMMGLGVRLDAGRVACSLGMVRHEPLGWSSALEFTWR